LPFAIGFFTIRVPSPEPIRPGCKFREIAMKPDIHPNYVAINVNCSCGNTFATRSTVGRDLQIEVCSKCHPFYTGKQKVADVGGRIDKFRKRYAGAAA
jgi:large subunit ribosomal protein L31